MLFSLLITVPLLLSIQAVTRIKAFSNQTGDQFLESSLEEETGEDYDAGNGVLCGAHRAAKCGSCGNEPGKCNGDCKWDAQTNKCQTKAAPAPSPYPQQPQKTAQSQQKQNQPGGGSGGGHVLCGGHRAPTCAQCGNEARSCNGDCKWEANKCQSKKAQGGNSGGPNNGNNPSGSPKIHGTPQKPINHQKGTFSRRDDPDGRDGDVLCGGHRAATCAQCGNEAGTCNADCIWEANKCQSKNGQQNLSMRDESDDSDCPEKDYDFLMNDIVPYNDSPRAGSWQECSERCRNNNDCKYWTLLGGKCLVKTSKSGKRSMRGAISGSRECGVNNKETGSPPSPSENPSPASEPPSTPQPAPEPTISGGFSDYEQQSLIAHNNFRNMEGAGLSNLVLDQSICQLVKAYANKAGRKQVMDHDYSQGMYENLHMAGAKLSPQEIAQSWMDEKTQPGCTDFACNGHYKIMVSPNIKKMCMAADNGGKKNWIVVARYS